ncbi:MAG: hypothetical protein ACMUHM_03270, partial [Thermoplasmatota archaeon]
MSLKGIRRVILGLFLSTALILTPLLLVTVSSQSGAVFDLVRVDDQEWGYDGCIDADGNVHLIHSTQEGLVFSDLKGEDIVNPRLITSEDAEQAAMIFTDEGYFLIAYIVEGDFFNTVLRVIKYSDGNIGDPKTVIEGAPFHNPTFSYYHDSLYLAFEQGGSAAESVGFSSDIAIISSQN